MRGEKKSGGNENERRKKSRKGMEMTGDMEKEERKEQKDSNAREEVFCLWMFWTYHLSL